MSATLFENVKIFDGERVIPSGYVLSEGGLISYIGEQSPSGQAGSNPDAWHTINGAGKTLLPGLIDSHVHAHLRPGQHAGSILRNPIRLGITTILDMHNDPDSAIMLKKECSECAEYPDLKSALYGATIEGGWPKPIVLHHDPGSKAYVDKWPNLTVDNAAEFVRSNKALGADYIKLMQENGHCMSFPNIPPASGELQSAVVKAAHENGLLAVAHATNMEETMLVLRAGVDGLMHSFSDRPPTSELVSLFKEKNAFLVPTLVTMSSVTGEEGGIAERFANDPLLSSRNVLTEEEKACMIGRLGVGGKVASISNNYEEVRALKAAGIDIVAGTDGVPEMPGTAMGVSLIMELWMYVEKCGFTNLDALRSATALPAKRFKFPDRGVIEKGRRADLLLVNGDPVDGDIRDLMKVDGVWKEGKKAKID